MNMDEVNYDHYRTPYNKARRVLEDRGYFGREYVEHFVLPGGKRPTVIRLFDREGQPVPGVGFQSFYQLRRQKLLQHVPRRPGGKQVKTAAAGPFIFVLKEGIENADWEPFKLRRHRVGKK